LLAKPRLIFVLLWDRGKFVLSRNFRLQNVGDYTWLEKNYGFNSTSRFIDELVVLNVSREDAQKDVFAGELRRLTEGVFTPVSAGGWVNNPDDVDVLLRNGADRVVLNSLLFDSSTTAISEIAQLYGNQCILGSLDVSEVHNEYHVFSHQGQKFQGKLEDVLSRLNQLPLGELMVTSIDRDGTGMGFDLRLADTLCHHTSFPYILCGGAGNARHLRDLYSRYENSALATAHLFNFIGSGLKAARDDLLNHNVDLARWDYESRYYGLTV
jgi:cyclase